MQPFLDLKAINERQHKELSAAASRVITSGWYVLGEEVTAFEREFANYCGARHCVGVASGLDALTLMLRATILQGRLQPGDEIVVPANTYIATILAASSTGLVPRPVEPDANTHNLCPQNTIAAITSRTRAIIVVHLYGLAAPMGALRTIADEHGLLLFEDAAQAHGAKISGQSLGGQSTAAAFSFYPGKNLGALGDGGALITEDDEIADTVHTLRNYGSTQKYKNYYIGVNSRLDELQAALLRVKLPLLDSDNARRRAIARRYAIGINNPLVQIPEMPADELSHVWHLFVVRCRWRGELAAHLRNAGVGTLVHYPIPPHQQRAYADSPLAAFQLPLTEQLANEVLSLPISPVMSDAATDAVITAVNAFRSK
ncbi:DegT/DnrJ/EryC1/StrS family aminotransferase [Candidatus Persebacteraceae bacterium Df01]|jgi:dTDP-4-amino-4,6-dideoxygalactose transaminase|uniref:DegT/DnrJ/EryC1/StrS family aminotransferase n=1 Tax=Candidatus Doriopsillibacter californiensis TaxID=2970740 RepID=A0ABT7QN58_9GAMM|nr:DegT/DnrJ/EryC1/StrS family aminotransferase [Candidatus Persebacteraceae bacterium Df01]